MLRKTDGKLWHDSRMQLLENGRVRFTPKTTPAVEFSYQELLDMAEETAPTIWTHYLKRYSSRTGPRACKVMANIHRFTQFNHILDSAVLERATESGDVPNQSQLKPIAIVPKNGTTREYRLFEARTDRDVGLIARAAYALFEKTTPDERLCGIRINNGELVPHIHSYFLFKRDCIELSKKFKNTIALDFKRFFSSLTYNALRELPNMPSYLEEAMKEFGHLTICSNYEHAIAGMFLWNRLKDSGLEFRSFVDDVVIFTDEPALTVIGMVEKLMAPCKLNDSKVTINAPIKPMVRLAIGDYNNNESQLLSAVLNKYPHIDSKCGGDLIRFAFRASSIEATRDLEGVDSRLVILSKQQNLSNNEARELIEIGHSYPGKLRWVIGLLAKHYSLVPFMYCEMEYIREISKQFNNRNNRNDVPGVFKGLGIHESYYELKREVDALNKARGLL